MKTFKEFMLEAFKSKEEAAAYYEQNPPVEGDPYYIRNKGSKENPKWAAIRKSSFKSQVVRRKERIGAVTGQLSGRQQDIVTTKKDLAKQRGVELHHVTSTQESDKIRRSMSPQEWEARKASDAKKGIYHGDDPKNLALAKGSSSEADKPGFEHSGYHAFERSQGKKLRDLGGRGGAIDVQTAYRILQGKKKRKAKELQSRMAAAYDKKIDDLLKA